MKLHLPSSLLSALLAVFTFAEPAAHAVEVPEGYISYYLAEPDELSEFRASSESLAFLLDGSLTITPDSTPWWTSTTPLKKNGSILFTIEEDGDPFSMTFKKGNSYPAFDSVSYLGFQDIGYVTFQNIEGSFGAVYSATTVEFINNRGVDFSSNASSSSGAAVYTQSLTIKETEKTITFSSNSSTHAGGAICGNCINITNNEGILFDSNSTKDDNYAKGGAIYGIETINLCCNDGPLTISNNYTQSELTWTHGSCGSLGGSIFGVTNSAINVSDNTDNITFYNNHARAVGNYRVLNSSYQYVYAIATAGGGAIYASDGAIISIKGNNGSILFDSNYAKSSGEYYGNIDGARGGAICAQSDSVLDLVDNFGSITFKGNYAVAQYGSTSCSSAYGGAIYIGSSGALNVSGNIRDVLFTANNAYNGGAIYADSGAILNFEATTDDIVFDSNTAKLGGALNSVSGAINLLAIDGTITFSNNTGSSKGGAVHGTGCTINICNNRGDINFLNNESTSYGGAIYDTSSVINICNNTGKIKFYGNTASTGAAIYGGDLIIQNNETVVFERNMETSGRLRSIYLDNSMADGGKFHVSAAEGKAITFTDSVYVQTSSNGKTVDVAFNGIYTAADESVIAQGGDIIFDGSQVESVLSELLDTAPTSTQIADSRTSYIGGVTNLKAGRLIVRGGAQFDGLGLSTTARSGAAVVLENAGMNHCSGSINIRRGTSLELSGVNQMTAGNLSFASASTLKFTIGAEQVTTANLTLAANLEHFSFGIALDGQEMLASGRYKLVELADATQYVDGSYWNADDITVTATGDAAGLGFDDLVWEAGVLYVEQGKSIWTNAGGDGSWNTTSTNWSRNGLGITYRDGVDVLFDGTAAGMVQLEDEVAPLSVTVENAAGQDYTFSGSGKLTGNTGIVKNGEGELSLATANEHTGGTQLNRGSLRVQHSSALGATTATLSTAAGSRLSIENGAQVVLAASEGNDLAGSVSIAAGASLEMQGSGYRAESTQLAGELVFNGSGVSQQAGSLSGSGSLRVTGSQTSVNMSSLDAYTGSLSVTGVGSQLSVGSGNYIGDGILQVSATGAEMNLCNSAVKIQKDGKLSVGNGATFSASAINVQNGAILEALKTDTSLSLSEVLLSNASQHEIKTQKFEYTGAFDAEAACNDFSSTLIAQVEGITIESGTTYHAASSNLNLAGCALTFSKGYGNPYISLVMELDDTYIAAETQIVLFSGVASFNIGEAVHQDSDTVYVFAAKDYLQGDYVFETTALVYDGNVGVVYLVEAVPEPTTATLSLLALAALAARRRRK